MRHLPGWDHFWWQDGLTYVVIERVAIKVPSFKQLDAFALILCPHATICERRIQHENSSRDHQKADGRSLVDDRILADKRNRQTSRRKVENLAQRDDGEDKRREIVVQEELTLHKIKGKVVKSPTQHRGSNLVVESLEGGVCIIVVASLPAKDGNALEKDVNDNGQCRAVPNDRVAHEVNLFVILTPEVDSSSQNGPRARAGVPSMRLNESSIGLPHDGLDLQELPKEARVVVIDLLRFFTEQRVLVVLDIPQAVGKGATTSAGNFLLLRGPVRQLDLVREQNATGHDVDQLELGLDSAQPLTSRTGFRRLLHNLDAEVVVRITFEAFVSIGRDLILPISLSDRGPNVVRVEATVGWLMVQSQDIPVLDVGRLRQRIPGISAVDRLAIDSERLGLILQEPHIVLILMRIQCDLLLLRSSRVHEGMRVKVAALSVDMANRDSTTHQNIRRDILHAL